MTTLYPFSGPLHPLNTQFRLSEKFFFLNINSIPTLAFSRVYNKTLTQPRAGPPISSTFFLRIYLTMAHLYVALGGAPPSLLPTYLLEVVAEILRRR